jgi:hypothetical protein
VSGRRGQPRSRCFNTKITKGTNPDIVLMSAFVILVILVFRWVAVRRAAHPT